MRKILPFVSFLLITHLPAAAEVKTWVGINTHWDDPNNWMPAGVPIKNDSVIINAGASFYPVLDKDLEVYKHIGPAVPATPYTCQYLYLASGASLSDDGSLRALYLSANADIFGDINMANGNIDCSVEDEILDSFHVNFNGATIHTRSFGTFIPFALGLGVHDTYTNCYIEGYISLGTSILTNTVLVGSVYFGSAATQMTGCTIRLKEKYGARIFGFNPFLLGQNSVPFHSSITCDITNDSPADDTLYIMVAPYPGATWLTGLNGNITINTANECARIYMGQGAHRVPANTTCPVTWGPDDSLKINGNITLVNKGIIEFKSVEQISGTLTINQGRVIRTYACAVNNFPPGDSLNCPINFSQGQLDLSAGKLVINADIAADYINNADASHYLVTNAAGSSLTRTVANTNGNVLFPVGVNDSYTPLYLSEAGATGINYSVRVSPGVYDQGTSGNLYTSKVVNRTWHISKPANANANATLTLQWNAADELPNFFHDYCSVSHFSNGVWHSGPGGLATGTGPFQQTLANQSSFSPFAVGSGGVLPLGCISFTGVQKDNKIELSWTTGSGTGHYHFLVQRSPDGIHFADIANIDAGIISASRNFYYSDTRFLNGDNYYRVFEVDAAGNKIQLCNIIRIKGSAAMPFVLLLQNPVRQQLPLQFTVEADQEVAIAVYDLAGRKLIGQQAFIKKGTSGYSVDISALARGQYLLKVSGVAAAENLFFTH
ncbi:MAG: T9SS type A sorting domain-containing protein [Ferruginibacter sp.]